MRITIYCKRQLKVVHYHPHVSMVSKAIAEARPHLGAPHEHCFELTVGVAVEQVDRQKDLLLLHEQMDNLTLVRNPHNLDSCSFERVCLWVKQRIPDAIYIKVDERDEGCEMDWRDEIEGAKL